MVFSTSTIHDPKDRDIEGEANSVCTEGESCSANHKTVCIGLCTAQINDEWMIELSSEVDKVHDRYAKAGRMIAMFEYKNIVHERQVSFDQITTSIEKVREWTPTVSNIDEWCNSSIETHCQKCEEVNKPFCRIYSNLKCLLPFTRIEEDFKCQKDSPMLLNPVPSLSPVSSMEMPSPGIFWKSDIILLLIISLALFIHFNYN